MNARVRKPTAERREEIARAALSIIGERGFPALTTSALAEAIGVTSGALFRHFASRDEILDEAVRWAVARVVATLPPPKLGALERLRALAWARVRLLRTEAGLAWLLRSEQALLSLPPAGATRLRALVRRSRSTIQTAIGEAIEAGDLRADVHPDVLLLTFTATIHALGGQGGLQGLAARPLPSERALEGLFHLLAPAARRTTRR